MLTLATTIDTHADTIKVTLEYVIATLGILLAALVAAEYIRKLP